MSRIRRAATVRGVVQGVSFRWYTLQEADRLGLAGWVRNEADGSVRVEVQGPDDDVGVLLDWVRHGPPSAHVTAVDVEEQAVDPDDIGFRIRD